MTLVSFDVQLFTDLVEFVHVVDNHLFLDLGFVCVLGELLLGRSKLIGNLSYLLFKDFALVGSSLLKVVKMPSLVLIL